MAKNVYEQREERNAEMNAVWFREMQKKPYEWKIDHAKKVAESYFKKITEEYGAGVYLSVGGLDSQTLHYFFEAIGLPVTCISCSSLEDRSNQASHQRIKAEMEEKYPLIQWYYDRGALPPDEVEQIDHQTEEYKSEKAITDACLPPPRFIALKPLMSKKDVLQRFGWPILSKETAQKIDNLQHPTNKNATVRHAIITGETGAYGGYQKNSRMKMSRKWLEIFGGADAEGAALGYAAAPFSVSDKCCYYLKEKPCSDWAKANNAYPYTGLMASEGGRRQKSLQANLCNYYGKGTTRSAPFAIFSRQDLLQLAIDLKVPVPETYGEILCRPDGTLCTTKAQRTGCSMCGFGIHLETRPNRFDRLKAENQIEWEFWMKKVCIDENGEQYGWGRVLDYCGIHWTPESLDDDIRTQEKKARIKERAEQRKAARAEAPQQLTFEELNSNKEC